MNTFAQAGALVPLARYEPQYARAIGKWMLNPANSARLFYPGAMPPGHESGERWKADPQHLIAYEGLRYEWQGKSPCATGDPVAMKWGPNATEHATEKHGDCRDLAIVKDPAGNGWLGYVVKLLPCKCHASRADWIRCTGQATTRLSGRLPVSHATADS
jgi:hypothetical protein